MGQVFERAGGSGAEALGALPAVADDDEEGSSASALACVVARPSSEDGPIRRASAGTLDDSQCAEAVVFQLEQAVWMVEGRW